MSKRLSQLYGLEIFTRRAEHVGRVEDVILNLDTGEVMRLCLRSFKAKTLPEGEVKRILQTESIGYNEVLEVGDVVICKKNPLIEGRRTVEEQVAPLSKKK